MRVLPAFVFVTAAILAPGLGAADPAQPATTTAATAPATAAPSATATATAQSAAAAAAPAAPATASADAGVNLDQVVCRSEPPTTGTRLGATRECHTVRQWNERQREDQRLLEQQQSGALKNMGN